MGIHGDSLRAAQTTPSSRTQTRRLQTRRVEAARRNRRLFLEPLETRALLAVIGVDDAYATLEDTPLHVSAAGVPDTAPGTWLELPGVLYNDTGSPTLTAELVGDPVYGDVVLHADGSFDYTPMGNMTETDSFTYRATDGVDYSELVTVEIHITPVNDPPQAIGDGYTVLKNTPLAIPASGVLLNDMDAEADPLSATLGDAPAHGTLTFGANGSFTFTPDAGYLGPDSFTYLVSDGAATDETTVSLTVVDQPPDVPTKAYTVQKNTPLTVPVADGLLDGVTDPDDPGVSFYALVTDGPQHGTVSVNPDGSFTYTPSSNYTGPDTFGVEIGHAGGGGAVAVIVVGLNVLQPNQAPVAVNDVFSLDEDTTRSGNVLANDDDPDTSSPLTASLVSTVSQGTLNFNADGTFLFTPLLNWFGTVTFTYTILDGGQPTVEDLPPGSLPIGFTASDFTTIVAIGGPLGSNVATVTIVVNPINDLPVTSDLTFGIDEDTQLVEPGGMYIGVTDPDNDPSELTPIIITPPAYGIIVISPGGSIVYTPDPGFVGSIQFGFIITDPSGSSNLGTGTITVEPVNDPPVAVDDAFTLDEDALYFAGGVGGNDTDPDGPSLTWSLASGVSHGNLILNSNGSFNYTPNINYHGGDSFSYTLTDGEFTGTATVTLTIQPISDAPVAVADAFATDEDTPVSGSVISNDFDPDDDPLTLVTLQTSPTNGSLLFDNSGSFTYTPNANYHGEDTFTYTVTDSTSLQSNVATVTITVNSINDAPTAQDQSYTLDEDSSLQVQAATGLLYGASDPENDPLTITIIDQPLHGTLTPNTNGGFTYTPVANYYGPDSFFFGVSDGALVSTATATLTINSINDAPTSPSLSDSSIVENNAPGDVVGTLEATDVDVNDQLTFELVAGPGDADNEAFAIAGVELRSEIGFNFEFRNEYSIRVRVTDSGSPQMFTESVFLVSIGDIEDLYRIAISDAPPEFESLGVTRLPDDAFRFARFAVSLSGPQGTLPAPIGVHFATSNTESAVGGSDYRITNTNLNMTTLGTYSVNVELFFDIDPNDAPIEFFMATLSEAAFLSGESLPYDVEITAAEGFGRIKDVAHPKVIARAVNSVVTEPTQSGATTYSAFEIALEAPNANAGGYASFYDVNVSWAITPVSTKFIFGTDTTRLPTQLTGTGNLSPGSKLTIAVPIKQDYVQESPETFELSIVNVYGGWDPGLATETVSQSATITVNDNYATLVWIEDVQHETISEPGQGAQHPTSTTITFKRDPASDPINVAFEITPRYASTGGCCSPIAEGIPDEFDFPVSGAVAASQPGHWFEVSFAEGQDTATIVLAAGDDVDLEQTLNLVISLRPALDTSAYAVSSSAGEASVTILDNDSNDQQLAALRQSLSDHISAWHTSATGRINAEHTNSVAAAGLLWDFIDVYANHVAVTGNTSIDAVTGLAATWVSYAMSATPAGAARITAGLVIAKTVGTIGFTEPSTPSAEKANVINALGTALNNALATIDDMVNGPNGYTTRLEEWEQQYLSGSPLMTRDSYITHLLCLQDELNRNAPVPVGPAPTSTQILGRALLDYATEHGFGNDISYSNGTWTSTYSNYPGLGSYDIAEYLNGMGYEP